MDAEIQGALCFNVEVVLRLPQGSFVSANNKVNGKTGFLFFNFIEPIAMTSRMKSEMSFRVLLR